MSDPGPRDWISIALITLFIAGWVVLFILTTPEELVQRLGVQQAYGVVFLLSVIGALGSMTTFSTYPALAAFAVGGMSLVALTAVAAVGLTVGDWIFFSLATRVKGLLGGRPRERVERLRGWLEDRPRWQISWVTWVWVGLLPLANNILTGALALSGFRFRRILVPLFLGNVTFPAGVAWLATLGVDLYG